MADVNVNFVLGNDEPIRADFQLEPDVTYTAEIVTSTMSGNHPELRGRDLPDQHPMGAITGLEEALEGLSDDITAENNRAVEAEEALDNKIDLEADTRADEITRVEDLISDEETRASEAETTLRANITAEENRAKGIEQQLSSSIDSNHQAISNHVSDKNNPHEVTKAQVGLGNVENIAPADMPLSTATKTYVDNADTVLQGQINTINTTIGGYGNIVTHNVSEFATANQGALADTALQPNDNISELTNNLNYQTATQVANSIAVETNNRESADNNLQSQIDAIVSASDVFDIVGTYAELQAYDISTVPVNDIIKVLVDSTHAGAATYYRCVETGNVKSWSYIGSEGAYYTKAEADSNFVPQTRTVNGKALSSDVTLTASDVSALPSSTVIPTVNDGQLDIQVNGSSIATFTANQSGNTTADITIPDSLPDQTGNAGKFLNTDGTGASWQYAARYMGAYSSSVAYKKGDIIFPNWSGDYESSAKALYIKYEDKSAGTAVNLGGIQLNTNDNISVHYTYSSNPADMPLVGARTPQTVSWLYTPSTNTPTMNSATGLMKFPGGIDGYSPTSAFGAVAFSNDYGNLDNKPSIPTATSELTNDSGFITVSALSGYATESWVTNKGYITGINSSDVTTALGYTPADDNNTVHKTGNETIGGDKTFSNPATFNSTTTFTTGTTNFNNGGYRRWRYKMATGDTYEDVSFYDDSGTFIGSFRVDNTGKAEFITFTSVNAPTPATSDNSTKVATTAFVKAQGYATESWVTNKGYITGTTTYTEIIQDDTTPQIRIACDNLSVRTTVGCDTNGAFLTYLGGTSSAVILDGTKLNLSIGANSVDLSANGSNLTVNGDVVATTTDLATKQDSATALTTTNTYYSGTTLYIG